MRRVRKILKRLLLGILGIACLMVALTVGTAAFIYYKPQAAWDFAQNRVLPADLKITWDQTKFSMHRLSGLNFNVQWSFQNLHVRKTKPLLDLPINETTLKISVFPFSPEKRWWIETATLTSEQDLLFIPDASKQKSPELDPFQQTQQILAWLRILHSHVRPEGLKISVRNFTLGGGSPLKIQAQVSPKDGQTLSLDANLSQSGKSDLKVSVQADLQAGVLGSDADFLVGQIVFRDFGADARMKFSIRDLGSNLNLKVTGPAHFRKEKMRLTFNPDLQLEMDQSKARVKLRSSVRGIPGPLVQVKNLSADVQVPFSENRRWSDGPSTFFISFPLDLFFVDANMRKPLEKSCACKIPETLAVQIKGRARIADLLKQDDHKKQVLEADLKIEDLNNRLITTDLAGQLTVEKERDQFLFAPHVDSLIVVHSFAGLRRFLDAKNILIPAPLNALDGTLQINARGPVERDENSSSFPVQLDVNLHSPRQKVNLQTKAQVRLGNTLDHAQVDVQAMIQDLQIELPPLDPIAGLPRVTPERRILKAPRTAAPKTKSKFRLAFSIQAETSRPGAIRLLTKYAKPYVPITLRIKRDLAGKTRGYLRIEPFDLVYLKRKIHLEKMRFSFDSLDQNKIPIEGRLALQQTEYEIFLDLGGTVTKPSLQLSSVPYLPRQEIISVLLYDETSDQLISSDIETIGSFDAAVSDRAIGLPGLWAFTSAPIRSFSYNPATKVYSATVALSNGLTAGVGTNWEEATQFQLRKRVSRRWVLTATWVPATEEDSQKEELVLQWEKRF